MTEVKSFVGLAGCYRKFIEGLPKIAAPLTALTHNGKKYEWTKNGEESFQELKRRLTSAPILIIPSSGELLLI